MSMTTGITTQESTSPSGVTRYRTKNWALQQQLYAAGGISFTYPVGLFSTPPTVQIAVEIVQPLVVLLTSLVTPVIIQNTTTQTDIIVNTLDLALLLLEAPTGSVVVHLRAQEP